MVPEVGIGGSSLSDEDSCRVFALNWCVVMLVLPAVFLCSDDNDGEHGREAFLCGNGLCNVLGERGCKSSN